MIAKIIKRDGQIVDFDKEKIRCAVRKARVVTGEKKTIENKVTDAVVAVLVKKFLGRIPSVEDVQDAVEEVLIKLGYSNVARAYILYRERRKEIRGAKKFYGVRDELKLGVNAIQVLQKRYLMKNEKGEIIETPLEMFKRVAKNVAQVDRNYGKDPKKAEKEFSEVMANLEFLPNSPTLMNAGTKMQQLSACFVLPVEDNLVSIFDAVKQMGIIQQSGGGVGFSFSRLRPKGDIVASTMGVASGPVSFMMVFDITTEVIKQGGRRRGANMAVLRVDHPDIIDFITAKEEESVFKNFNLSVAVTEKFISAVRWNKKFELINPRTEKVVKKVSARDLFDLICTMAWRTGDPGLIFLDRINKAHTVPGEIEATNPCSEAPLLPFESCNLGSINLSKFIVGWDGVKNGRIDWGKLGKVIQIGIHFLDNVIGANKYLFKEIERATKQNRKIGLGVMGFAEMLIKLGVPYNSKEAFDIAGKIMSFVEKEARDASIKLGVERGSFPNFDKSKLKKKFKAMRNASVTTIAPTGSISIIAGTSSGIEPLFAVSFVREVLEGTSLFEVNNLFREVAVKKGFYSEGLMEEVARSGSVKNVVGVPSDVKRLFVTALDINPEWHVRMEAAFQKYTDQGISKTVNLQKNASIEDVKKVFWLAYKLGCKSITVYRYGSKKEQVFYLGGDVEKHSKAEPEYSGGCFRRVCIT